MRRTAAHNGVLVEVAAQHPLVDGRFPNREFEARLQAGFELYRSIRPSNRIEIYVPGSRHRHEGRDDEISLSAAGTAYLVDLGVPKAAIRGDDLNRRYTGDDGVYGSQAECYVAARYYKDAGFGRFRSVVSPFQATRKLLHYIQYGVLPDIVSVQVDEPFHNLIDEVFVDIPRALRSVDETPLWQSDVYDDRRPD